MKKIERAKTALEKITEVERLAKEAEREVERRKILGLSEKEQN